MKEPNSRAPHASEDSAQVDPGRGTDGPKAVEINPTGSDPGNPRDPHGHRRQPSPQKES